MLCKFRTNLRGTSVLIRRDIVETGFLITFGAVSHHYFAGYGGGRKLIFPGLGHKASIYHNHGLFLDRKRQTLSPYCQSGVLDKNPLAEDLAEFETFCPADMAIHGILDSRGQVCDLLPGAGTDHFETPVPSMENIVRLASPETMIWSLRPAAGIQRILTLFKATKPSSMHPNLSVTTAC